MERAILGRTVRGPVDVEVRAWLDATWVAPLARRDPRFVAVSPTGFVVELVPVDAPVPAAVHDAEAGISPAGTRHVRGSEEFWILEGVAGAVHGHLGEHGARLELHGRPFGAWYALRSALLESLNASGLLWIHAAAIHDGSRTLALLGPTGRGKSTTLLRAALQGWQPVAEDGCFVELPALTIVGADRCVRLRPPMPAVLGPTPGGLDPGPLVDGRYEISYARLGGGVPAARLTHLVRLVRTPGVRKPAWAPLDRAGAVMTLYESIGVPETRRVGTLVARACREIVGRTRHTALEVGEATRPIPPLVDAVGPDRD